MTHWLSGSNAVPHIVGLTRQTLAPPNQLKLLSASGALGRVQKPFFISDWKPFPVGQVSPDELLELDPPLELLLDPLLDELLSEDPLLDPLFEPLTELLADPLPDLLSDSLPESLPESLPLPDSLLELVLDPLSELLSDPPEPDDPDDSDPVDSKIFIKSRNSASLRTFMHGLELMI